ncbi:hypothetical protein AgCh_008726 [Apium graveolens]
MFPPYAAVSYPPMLSPLYYIQTGTKILLSNLDYEVSDDDIKACFDYSYLILSYIFPIDFVQDLFSVVGDVKKISVQYDNSGRSKGTAEVVYSQWKDAEAAVKRYNNIQLDGKPMEVKIVGMLSSTSVDISPYGSYGLRRDEGRGSELTGFIRGGNIHTRGRGPGRRRGENTYRNISAEELDADLDKYGAEGIQTR